MRLEVSTIDIPETLYDHLHILAHFNNVTIQIVKTDRALPPSSFIDAIPHVFNVVALF